MRAAQPTSCNYLLSNRWGSSPRLANLPNRSPASMGPHQSLLERSTWMSTHPQWSARRPSWSSTRFPPTTESWADLESARSRPSHLLYIRRSAIPSLGVGSGRSTVTKPWQGDAPPKGSRRASSCSSHQ
ncbi:unnamed protein product [Prunus armeniaca]